MLRPSMWVGPRRLRPYLGSNGGLPCGDTATVTETPEHGSDARLWAIFSLVFQSQRLTNGVKHSPKGTLLLVSLRSLAGIDNFWIECGEPWCIICSISIWWRTLYRQQEGPLECARGIYSAQA